MGDHDGLLEDLVDHALPVMSPYDFSVYVLLLRLTDFQGGEVRIGKRSIGVLLGKGTRSSGGNYQHVTEKVQSLAAAGFIATIGDTTREGTLYLVRVPDGWRPTSLPTRFYGRSYSIVTAGAVTTAATP